MSVVSYNSKKLIPAPFVAISKEYSNATEGYRVGSVFRFTVIGKIVAHKGSPTSLGAFHTTSGYPADETIPDESKLKSIIRKQEAIRELFRDEGRSFEIQSADGSAPIKCNPRIISITFPEGNWYNTCDYTIELEADVIHGPLSTEEDFPVEIDDLDLAQYIKSASENWTIEENRDNDVITYVVTHNISAVGKRHYDSTGTMTQRPWEWARDFVATKISNTNPHSLITNLLMGNISGHTAYSQSTSENIDQIAGSYSYTRVYTYSDQNYTENFTVTTDTSETRRITVTVSGEIRGLGDTQSARFTNATNAFSEPTIYSRALTYSGATLHVEPLTKSVGKSPSSGIVSYNYSFNDRPSSFIAGAISESISLSRDLPGDVFASIFVLGRTAGPVLQNLSTKTARRQSVNIEALMPVSTTLNFSSSPSAAAIAVANSLRPVASIIFEETPVESWNALTGNYSYSISWTYEV